MVATDINMVDELSRFFKSVTRPGATIDRQYLLLLFWEPLLERLPIGEKLVVYHCFNAYEKAYREFAAGDHNLGQNSMDYADYHSYDVTGQPREGLDILRHLALAVHYNEAVQFENALAELEQSGRLLAGYGPEACLLHTMQSGLLSDAQYAVGQTAAGADTAADLVSTWAFRSGEVPDGAALPEQHRKAFVHHVTNAALHNIHDWLHGDQPGQNAQLETVFRAAWEPAADPCPVQGYSSAVQLLAGYHAPGDDAFARTLAELLPVLSGMPVFVQYFLLKKLMLMLEETGHSDLAGVRHTMQRYFVYIGVDSLLNTKKNV